MNVIIIIWSILATLLFLGVPIICPGEHKVIKFIFDFLAALGVSIVLYLLGVFK